MNQYKYTYQKLKDFATLGFNAKKFVGVVHKNGVFLWDGKTIILVEEHKE
jgi:hypothetical protein